MALTSDTASPSPSASGSSMNDALSSFAQFLADQGGTTGTGRVYMGMGKTPAPTYGYMAPGEAVGRTNVLRNRTYLSTEDAYSQYDKWNTKKQDDFLAKLKVAGLVQSDAGPIEAYKIWTALVDESARKTANGQMVSPFDILGSYVSQAGGTGKGAWVKDSSGKWETNVVTNERRYIGPRFATTTDSRVDYTDPATARAIATKMFQDLMGRDPGKGELASFGSALATAEATNPTVATTTTEYATSGQRAGEAIGSSTVSSGGMTEAGREQLAGEQIKGKKEYGATQAATTYMNALENAVYGAPG